jgi:UPF0042 nucleotide-binding protein
MRFIIISGRSGSGKTACLTVLEDLGFYCISNLPLNLFASLPEQLERTHPQVVVSIDVRDLENNNQTFAEIIAYLDEKKIQHETIFVDASDERLLERFSETRRKHPLSTENRPLKEALQRETELLEPVAVRADLRIDTTELSLSDLRRTLTQRVAPEKKSMSLLFQSFGYKKGIPLDSDYVFDVRCLPNPYWEPPLRTLTGRDQAVIEFLEKQTMVNELLQNIITFLERWIPEHKINDRNYLTVSIGCTGGQHRSVYIAEKLYNHFAKCEKMVQLRHNTLSVNLP